MQVLAQYTPVQHCFLTHACMQGAALEALKAFLVTLLGLGGSSGGASFDQLLSGLLAAGNAPSTGKSAQHAVAQCIASLCAAAGYEATMRTVTSLLAQLQTSQRSSEVRGSSSPLLPHPLLQLLCLHRVWVCDLPRCMRHSVHLRSQGQAQAGKFLTDYHYPKLSFWTSIMVWDAAAIKGAFWHK